MVAAALSAFAGYVFYRRRQSQDGQFQDPSLFPADADTGADADADSDNDSVTATGKHGAERVSTGGGRWTPPWAEGTASLPSSEEARFHTETCSGEEDISGSLPYSCLPKRRACVVMTAASIVLALIVAIVAVTRPKASTPIGEVEALLGLGPHDEGDGAEDAASKQRGTIHLQSGAFEDWGPIPQKYTADGLDVSPPLSWSGLPPLTRSLVLICDDPAASKHGEEWNHWIVFDMHPTMTGLSEDVAHKPVESAYDELEDGIVAFRQGLNSWGDSHGWKGPDPPHGDGEHWYEFRLFAVDVDTLRLDPANATKDTVVTRLRMKDINILGYGTLTGTYER